MTAELSEKLRSVFRFTENDIRAVMYELRRISKKVAITGYVHVVAADADDDKFVECDLVGDAPVIVSGDQHLLRLGQYENVKVLTAAEFVVRFQGSS